MRTGTVSTIGRAIAALALATIAAAALAREPMAASAGIGPPATAAPRADASAARELATRSACLTCHDFDMKIVGPALRDIAARYAGQADAQRKLIAKVRNGGQGVWGTVAMPAQPLLSDEELRTLVGWILDGAR